MPVVNPAEAKNYLRIAGAQDDFQIETVLDAAEAAVATRVGPLEPTPVTSRVDGGYTILRLPTYPLISVQSVTPSNGETLDVADLSYDAAGILKYATGSKFFTAQAYDVAYTAGRATLPNDLKVAVLELVRHLWQSQRASNRSGANQSTETANTIPGAANLFPFRVEQLLAPYDSPKVS